jgi:hypothetical protein
MQLVVEQQPVVVQPFEHPDRSDGLLDGDPGFVAKLAFGDLLTVLVAGALELAAFDGPEIGDGIVCDATSFEIEHYWRRGRIPNVRYSSR